MLKRREYIKKGITLMFLAFIFCFPGFTFAETIVLKSGKTIEGQIVEKTADYIKVKEGMVYITYFLDKIESIDGEKVEYKKIITRTTRSLPKTSTQKASEAGFVPGVAVTKQFDELFVEQCLEFFKDKDFNYAAFYKRMSSQAKKTEFEDMVNLFSAEEKILGRLKEYRKFNRIPPAGSSSPPSMQASFQYVCVFDKSEGVVTVDIVTENKELKVSSFRIVSPAFLRKEGKALLAKVKVETAVRATLRTLSNAFETYAVKHKKEYPTDVDAQLINTKPQYLKENYFTKCTVANATLCSDYVYNPGTLNVTVYNLTGRPINCSVYNNDTKSFTVITGGNLTTDKNCTAAQ